MPTKDEISAQIRSIGYVGTVWTRKEIKSLPALLTPDETVLGLASGWHANATWVVVCTNKRVIFLDKGLLYGLRQKDVPLDKINSITQETGMIWGTVGIWDGASKMSIERMDKRTVAPFTAAVRSAMERRKSPGAAAQPPQNDVVSQLERLAALRTSGVLNDAEFSAQKAKLLGA